ncbi:DUF6465 family protein [Clostridium estertheticum]|uniref:DUF6465 family protein n=1 Tax=Clostridium estertheticum TaxID=238834 RepID=UPI001CF3F571|nr:DUF6465 family protein [Clostridium estertheticum]MCB2307478.1 DUF6465 family protein [Clostridium estertheticum]MCB2345735.1 DUF6465 family protein [Clostridium estertheticum]MCB2350967.1 DUF6465 family protein [Clostridium estertheticum]WAG47859.1 DUF6465 family protein [Clostridium estertheticum]
MEKDNTLTSDKKATGEGTEEAITIVSDVTKENVGKTISVVKDVAKNVKSKAKKVTTGVKKTAAKRTISKKIDVGFYVQYQGKEISKGTILEEVYKEWTKSHKITELKTLDVYIKVEEDIAYCLVNGEIKINIKLS